jgi:menaquinone-dependent protoporphyrinogen IX oxidase
MPPPAMSATNPKVLLAYYTYTQQARKVVDAMADVFTQRGCEVTLAAIEFTDKRYQERFTRFPLKHLFIDLFGMLPAQLRRATGEIRIPPEAQQGGYDLVVIGSPTWWLTTSMPVRSFLKTGSTAALLEDTRFTGFVVCRRYWGNNLKTVRKLGTKNGGRYLEGVHYKYQGGQIRSLLSLFGYLSTGENLPKYHGVSIPPTNLQPPQLDDARTFASGLADQLAS